MAFSKFKNVKFNTPSVIFMKLKTTRFHTTATFYTLAYYYYSKQTHDDKNTEDDKIMLNETKKTLFIRTKTKEGKFLRR